MLKFEVYFAQLVLRELLIWVNVNTTIVSRELLFSCTQNVMRIETFPAIIKFQPREKYEILCTVVVCITYLLISSILVTLVKSFHSNFLLSAIYRSMLAQFIYMLVVHHNLSQNMSLIACLVFFNSQIIRCKWFKCLM